MLKQPFTLPVTSDDANGWGTRDSTRGASEASDEAPGAKTEPEPKCGQCSGYGEGRCLKVTWGAAVTMACWPACDRFSPASGEPDRCLWCGEDGTAGGIAGVGRFCCVCLPMAIESYADDDDANEPAQPEARDDAAVAYESYDTGASAARRCGTCKHATGAADDIDACLECLVSPGGARLRYERSEKEDLCLWCGEEGTVGGITDIGRFCSICLPMAIESYADEDNEPAQPEARDDAACAYESYDTGASAARLRVTPDELAALQDRIAKDMLTWGWVHGMRDAAAMVRGTAMQARGLVHDVLIALADSIEAIRAPERDRLHALAEATARAMGAEVHHV